ncbi:hypothetical protein CcaCcLH18_12001 [Colletotrichum camelliae]|nr:hypothetical protein CcaCcLH18_12001 [Colletotrichum camelliae]
MRYAATFQLDPDGDVELILRNPDAPFAVWDDSEDAAVQDLNAYGPELLISTGSTYTPRLEPATPTKGYFSLFKWADRGKDEIQEAAFPEDLLDIDNPFEVDGFGEGLPHKFLLSSRHLILASSVFKKELSGP